jgi:hypothetical protein
MRTGALIMTGTPAFLVLFSLIARLHAIPLAVEELAVLAVSCALLLLTRFEGAISCRTEIDTGTSAAATLSAPDTPPLDHLPPRRRTQSLQRRQPSILTPLARPRRPNWSASQSLSRRLLQPNHAQSQPSSQLLRRAPNLPPRRGRHSVTFPIPAPGVSIASG